jgi:tRNA (uracil-5-)-methyltransferase TRM9
MDFETEHVHKVYELIAHDFSRTRYNVWPSVKDFLDLIPADDDLHHPRENSNVLEVGSGNGKNLMYLEKVKNKTGCDMSDKFVEMVVAKGINCLKANAIELPFPTDQFDYTLSVAVVHHLSNEERRLKAIEELIRVTKPGGLVFIQVWAFEQNLGSSEREKPGRKLKFKTQDTMVSWNNTHDRYYHVFKKGELEALIGQIVMKIEILETKYDYGNWMAIIKKQ